MFQFNFSVAADDQDGDAVVDDGPSEADVSQSSTSALADPARDPCREVLLTELVSALPTEVAYTLLAFPGTALLLPRRDFHDARLSSLAATADGELAGEELLEEVFDARSDVRPGRYEGGMKTWEGAGDLVGVLRGLQRPWGSVLEIGCGTAIPTLYLLAQVFASESPAQPERETRVCLQDYNRPVLELVRPPLPTPPLPPNY
ncbi:hypothetical protein CALCODRAFT_500215 [Calocera cornea HHB12733]|uniref:S-adenosyl-L-methionine-dependent methyltransferase n=1 Tax=Calocera cornea HHB12733 TaxID=1353952 RepID=A0A165E667_9BASI|nr:hypothetical protein CALCODRAFT_500215 [Calocera cornea HHB12733]